MQKDVGLSYYTEYLQNPHSSEISSKAIDSMNAIFLLKLMYSHFEKINSLRPDNEYLFNIFNNRLVWTLKEIYSKIETISSRESLCFMIVFNEMFKNCLKVILSILIFLPVIAKC